MQTESFNEFFGTLIYSYTRAQALEDGFLVDLMQDEMESVCKSVFDFKMVCGPNDDGTPCMTIMLPNED